MLKSIKHFTKANSPLVKNMILKGCKTIGYGSHAHALDIIGIVSCSTGVVIPSIGNTVINQHGKKRSWQEVAKDFFNNVAAFDFNIKEMNQLFVKSIEQFLKTIESAWITGNNANLYAGLRIYSIV